jgi:two-component system OmpR family response regulator
MRVLLVEDDAMIGAAVEGALKDAAYAVDWLRDGRMATLAVASQTYDIIVLDLGLPGCDGMDILAEIRKANDPAPVVIMTARDEVTDRIRGLDIGADDYLTKPFALSELLARMRAVMRRRRTLVDTVMSSGDIKLDTSTRQVRVGESTTLQLSRREYTLLEALMNHPGAILSRSQLEDRVYGWGEEVESNAIEFLIHALRKKVGHQRIKNIRGVGWMVSGDA